MPHLVLLGDSIFDNARYTSGSPDVVSQVRGFLPSGWSASLSAIDNSTTDNVADQLQHLPKEATHLALSVGGNNALPATMRTPSNRPQRVERKLREPLPRSSSPPMLLLSRRRLLVLFVMEPMP